jgi:propanol-preferring alcohol dehydrogenase
MKAMILKQPQQRLQLSDVETPAIEANQVLIEVEACGVCRTDLHIMDGELKHPKLPLIPGHEIVGRVAQLGNAVKGFKEGQRVGVPWLAYTCGKCFFCLNEQENLCDNAIFTGYTKDGGYGECVVANENYCFAVPDKFDSISLAPLLCAGLIGWRSYRLAGQFKRLGLYGFGGAAHILIQIAHAENKEVYAFTRPGDEKGQKFARQLGAAWAGDSDQSPPNLLDASIIFAPAGPLVLSALKASRKGGTIVCGGIHMSNIPPIPYELLWGERSIRSVANLTREDARTFFETVERVPLKTSVTEYKLEKANQALDDLREARFEGAAVLSIKS